MKKTKNATNYTINLSPEEIKILKGAKHILLNLENMDKEKVFFNECLEWANIDHFYSIGIMLGNIIHQNENK